jgi:hypothetical protein
MKRARDDEEEKEIDDIEATLTNVPEEMRKEVYSHMQWAMAGGENSGWHLESVMQVSKLLYASIYEVARIQFKILAETTVREMKEWGGWTLGRPLSLAERFGDSPLGAMSLSYAWCMHHFYTPSHSYILNSEQRYDIKKTFIPHGYFGYEALSGDVFNDYMDWVLGLVQVSPAFDDPDLSLLSMRPKSNDVSDLYLYFRYGTLPPVMIEILHRNLAYVITGAANEMEWRRMMANTIVSAWLRRGREEPAYIFDWLVYFENNSDTGRFELRTSQRINFTSGIAYYFYNYNEMRDLIPSTLRSAWFEYETFLAKSLDKNDVFIAPNSPSDGQLTTSIDTIHLVHPMDVYAKWQRATGFSADRYSTVTINNRWAEYILKSIAPTLPLFAKWMHHLYPTFPMWERLAALPPRPGDPPMSDRLKEILGL